MWKYSKRNTKCTTRCQYCGWSCGLRWYVDMVASKGYLKVACMGSYIGTVFKNVPVRYIMEGTINIVVLKEDIIDPTICTGIGDTRVTNSMIEMVDHIPISGTLYVYAYK